MLKDFESNSIKLDGIYTSEDLKAYKPQKEFYTRILERIGYTTDEVVFVGDSLKDDIYGPQQLGIFAVLIDRENKYDGTSNIKPNAIIHSLAELENAIENI